MKTGIVLLPGLDGTGKLFKRLLEVIPDDCNALPVSYPPAAFMDYSELTRWVMKQLPRQKPYVLLGESFSGPVAVKIAALKPTNLKGIVLCNSFVISPVSRAWGIAPWRRAYRMRPPTWALRHYLVERMSSDDMCKELRTTIRDVNPGVLAERTREVLRVDVRDELSSLRIPILYLRGNRDKLVKPKAMQVVKQYAPHTDIATFPGPHLLLQSMPQLCWSRLCEFMFKVRTGIEA